MLRAMAALVLLLNIVLGITMWAVHQGYVVWPDAWRGVSREPERLTRQVKPEAMIIKPAKTSNGNNSTSPAPANSSSSSNNSNSSDAALGLSGAASSAAAANASVAPAAIVPAVAAAALKTLCLQSKDNESAIATRVKANLIDLLPTATVQSITSLSGGLWMVYMGKYADVATATKKLTEVKALKIPGDYALIRNTEGLQPGISLGAFRSKDAANTRLQEVGKKGVKSARVVEVTAPKELNTLRLSELDETLREKAVQAITRAGGKAPEACAQNTP
jgi:hypothetical protein